VSAPTLVLHAGRSVGAVLPTLVATALLMSLAASPASAHVDKARLPIGDGKYGSSAKKGYVYSCQEQFPGGGPSATGPWINSDGETWDLTEKVAVSGSVSWPSSFSASVSGSNRLLSGNGLPSHTTGVFPVASSDPAYEYDRNPNSISNSNLSATVPRNPTRNARAGCLGMGAIGVLTSGARIYNAFDAGGQDAAAHEVQDRCEGHPQQEGQYHYHSLSSCIRDRRGSKRKHSTLIGWALDGFGIYGQYGRNGHQLSTSELNACHGHTHVVKWNGKRVRKFHYHATLDFPYFLSCYQGTATAAF
jgi:hypothetical protein